MQCAYMPADKCRYDDAVDTRPCDDDAKDLPSRPIRAHCTPLALDTIACLLLWATSHQTVRFNPTT